MDDTLIRHLRIGLCEDKCRARDARAGCMCSEAADTIERLTLENWQLKGELGYAVPGHIPQGPFKCGLCEAKAIEIKHLQSMLAEIHAMSQEHLVPAWQVIENIAALARQARLDGAPIFECPDCGKDIADADTKHAPECARASLTQDMGR